MLYFKFKNSFKKAGALTDLIEKQEITKIREDDNFTKRFAKGEDIYAFICPYHSEIKGETVLDWGNTEGEAWDLFFMAQEAI